MQGLSEGLPGLLRKILSAPATEEKQVHIESSCPHGERASSTSKSEERSKKEEKRINLI